MQRKISPEKCGQCPLMYHGIVNGKVVWNLYCLKDKYCAKYSKKL